MKKTFSFLIMISLICIVFSVYNMQMVKAADSDLDGWSDSIDNCASDFNPDQWDSDNDLIGDVCDACPLYPDPDESCADSIGNTTLDDLSAKMDNNLMSFSATDANIANMSCYITQVNETYPLLRMGYSTQGEFDLGYYVIGCDPGDIGHAIVGGIWDPSAIVGFYYTGVDIDHIFNIDVWFWNVGESRWDSQGADCLSTYDWDSSGWCIFTITGPFSLFGVKAALPRNYIISPENKTYTSGLNIPIEFLGSQNHMIPPMDYYNETGWTNYTIFQKQYINLSNGDYTFVFNVTNNTAAVTNSTPLTFSVSESVGDTCTPPAADNDWFVSWSDNCTLTSNTNLGAGNFTVNGSTGKFTLNANLTVASKRLIAVIGAKFIMFPGAQMWYVKK